MTNDSFLERFEHWISPLVFLSTNWISYTGVILVTSAAVLWLFLLPAAWGGSATHPYLGILAFLILPGAFFAGLALIPVGIFLARRKARSMGQLQEPRPPLDLRHGPLRRLLIFIGVTTFANVLIGSQFTVSAIHYMDSVQFCGTACHSVMAPEYGAYLNSPHSRVSCVECHIGPGAGWFVKSKISGIRQVFKVALNTHPRPIPTPIEDLRPARETCEICHWPQKFGSDRLRRIPKFAEDEANTRSETVLLMRIGGGDRAHGIHGVHLGEGVTIRYRHADNKRQEIPWVESSRPGSETQIFQAPDTKSDEIAKLPMRVMDCMDCHNRPTHTFEIPERALDEAIDRGDLPRNLPFLKKKALELIKKEYPTGDEARAQILALFEAYYKESHPAVYTARRPEIERSARTITAIYSRNVYPEMKVSWGTYTNQIGHTDFPGCFRCHDDNHSAANGKKIHQDCNSCHQLLAMEEAAPKILSDLGIAESGGQ